MKLKRSQSDNLAKKKDRKRNWDVKHPSYLEERSQKLRKTHLRTVRATIADSKEWLKCGEGFQDSSGTLSLETEKTDITEKHLELSPRLRKAETISKKSNEIGNITWSSSENDFSDEDKTLSKLHRNNSHDCKIDSFYKRNTFCSEDGDTEDELQFIDWEIDSDEEDADERSDCEDGESAVYISDCASCASSHSVTHDDTLSELPKPVSTEILEYSSDSDKEDDSESVLFIDSESPHKCLVDLESDDRQCVDKETDSRTKSTEPILCTPNKQATKFPRTPESSAKNKKLLRGGLAERLNILQNREKSAISLWRHQCVSNQKILSGGKSGVLIVRILELHEECTMQVAKCKVLAGPSATTPPQGVASSPGDILQVLFTRETASYLRERPQDIIHIFPPWQKLTSSGHFPVILNTYFSQKVASKETAHEIQCWDTSLLRRNISLAQMFRIKDLLNNSHENQIVCSSLATMSTGCTQEREEATQHLAFGTPLRDSILDIVESQRAALWPRVQVQVVVQRVYSLAREGARGQQSHAMGHTDPPRARICLLVQDAYGMFGEVHLEGTIRKEKQLEGRSCTMTGMKVLQKATRERTPGLFSLIDTIWPPMMPLKAPDHGQHGGLVKTYLPPPAFCYILSSHHSLEQIDVIDGATVSKLYQPPALHCLREILQTGENGIRYSFYARVIYQRPQLKNLLLLEQREILLLVTDITLQTKDESDPDLPKTLPVCVAPSCVLDPEVLEAFAMTGPYNILFRDALRDQGRIVCVDRTVLLPQEPPLNGPSSADSWEPTGPVMLDKLSSLTIVNSICTVQGVVVGVDESTAFSWPVCDQCGNGRLEQKLENGRAFFCGECSRLVMSPIQKRHLQVFLDCSSRPQSTVKVKLSQSSISSLLRFAASEDGSYEVRSVLGKEVGSLLCFVQSIVPHPTSCIGLEEIELLGAEGAAEPTYHP